jgi:hypothetical protein
MSHLSPAQHETNKRDSPNETKVKEKQKNIPDSNSNLAKSMTHHNQTKELTTWFLKFLTFLSSGKARWFCGNDNIYEIVSFATFSHSSILLTDSFFLLFITECSFDVT